MALVPALTPLRLLYDRSLNLGHPRREPLAYAYVLIDLTGTPVDEMAFVQATAGGDGEGPRRDRPGRAGLRVSDEVTWRLALRTDRHGYLKDPFRLSTQPDEADTDSAEYHDLLDRAPPFGIMPGLELNLWWCRDRDCYEAALLGEERRRGADALPTVTRERQLLKVSTKLRRRADVAVVADLAARFSPDWTPERVARAVMVEDPAYARQTPVFEVDARGRVLGLVLELEDAALTYALHLAGRILTLSEFSATHELPLVQAYMERLHQVLERYERGDVAVTDRFNTILEDASRRDREYSAVRFNLGRLPRELRRTILDAGERLDRLWAQAVDDATWHHPRQRGAESVAFLTWAMAVVLGPEVWEHLLSTPRIDARCARVLRGEPEEPATPLLRMLKGSWKVVQWTNKSSTVARQASQWIEVGLSQAMGARTEEQVVELLENAARLMATYEDTGGAAVEGVISRGDPLPVVLELGERTVLRRTVQTVQVARGVRTSAWLGRLSRAVAVVNAALAFYEACDDPSFRNFADAAQNVGEVIDKIDRLKAYICEHCHLDPELFGEVVGAWGVAISFVDALEAGRQGNRVAMIGHVMGGAGGVVELMATRGSPAGFIAAVLIISGAAVVAFSLSDDAAWVLEHFDDISEGRRSRSQDAESLVRRADRLMTQVRSVIRGAEREAAALGF